MEILHCKGTPTNNNKRLIGFAYKEMPAMHHGYLIAAKLQLWRVEAIYKLNVLAQNCCPQRSLTTIKRNFKSRIRLRFLICHLNPLLYYCRLLHWHGQSFLLGDASLIRDKRKKRIQLSHQNYSKMFFSMKNKIKMTAQVSKMQILIKNLVEAQL